MFPATYLKGTVSDDIVRSALLFICHVRTGYSKHMMLCDKPTAVKGPKPHTTKIVGKALRPAHDGTMPFVGSVSALL